MEFTGERMVPTAVGWDELFFEHVARYAFAARHVTGRRVLDAGCGSGYGSYYLKRAGAEQVVGVDTSLEAIRYCRENFSADNLEFLPADGLQLPLADHSLDVAVCFEVFEHVAPPERLLDELRRVLSPEGLLLISTPNALTYDPGTEDGVNPFHVKEYSPTELRQILGQRFPHIAFYVQNPFGGIGIFPADQTLDAAGGIELRVLSPRKESPWGEPREIHAAAEKSSYVIAECGAVEPPAGTGRLYAMAADLSDTTLERRAIDSYVERLTEEYGLLKSEQESSNAWMRSVVEQLTTAKGELERLHTEHAALSDEYSRRTDWTRSLQKDLDEAVKAHQDLEGYLRQVENQLEQTHASRQNAEQLAQSCAATIDELRQTTERQRADLEEKEQQIAALREQLAAATAEPETPPVEALEPETLAWAHGLAAELEKATVEVARLHGLVAELQAGEETTTRWARSLEQELENTRAELERTRAAYQAALDDDQERAGWAENLERLLAETREELSRARRSHAELEKADQERAAWAKELEQRLLEAHAELGRLSGDPAAGGHAPGDSGPEAEAEDDSPTSSPETPETSVVTPSA